MLETWVNQNSGSLNSPGVEAVGTMLRARARAARLQGRLDRHEARRPRGTHRRPAQGQWPRQAHAADRPSRYGVRAGLSVPALGAQGRSRHRPGLRRRQGRNGGDDRRAARDEGGRHAEAGRHHGRADRRRRGCGRPDRGHARAADRGRQMGRRRARLRRAGAEGRQGHGLDRAAQLRQLDGDRQRPQRPFERRDEPGLSARITSWRGSSTPSGASSARTN